MEPIDLQNFFNISPSAMCVLNSEFKIIKTNISFEKILEYSIGEIAGKSIFDFIHPEEKTVAFRVFSESATSNTALPLNSRMITKSGSVKWFKWRISNPSESPHIFAVANDYTNEQEARNLLIKRNRQIAEDRAKTDALLANIGDGVIGISDGGNIQYVNESAQNILGFSEGDLKDKLFFHAIVTVDELGKPVDINKLPIRDAIMSGKAVSRRDLQFIKKDGSPIPVAITASIVKYQTTLMGVVVVFRDITEEREIDRMKTEFISLASHQLRTPLSAMKWFSEMLIDGDIGELSNEQMKVVVNINKSNERMIDLVNSLLNISRIESGRLIVEPIPTDIKTLVGEVILELEPQIKEKKQNLTVTIQENLPKISIDPKLVRHVYMNLLTNAIKYTADEGNITISVRQQDQEIITEVTDSGYGIPQAQKKKVFEKFFRADNIKKVETDGTGLGLYLAKKVIEASQGKIWFKSEVGKGSVFSFTLPVSGSKPRKGEVTLDT